MYIYIVHTQYILYQWHVFKLQTVLQMFCIFLKYVTDRYNLSTVKKRIQCSINAIYPWNEPIRADFDKMFNGRLQSNVTGRFVWTLVCITLDCILEFYRNKAMRFSYQERFYEEIIAETCSKNLQITHLWLPGEVVHQEEFI